MPASVPPLKVAPPAGGVAARGPGFREALRFWVKLGFISFGGPTGQIAIMHAELVERRRWIEERAFLHALNYCMLLPGPEAQQLAVYCGWLLHGTRGGLAAGFFFVLPSVFILLGLSAVYVAYGQVAWISGLFYGLKPAVLAVVAAAVVRVGRKALPTRPAVVLAAAAFGAIFFFHVPYPFVILGAALAGWAARDRQPAAAALAGIESAAPAGRPARPGERSPARAVRVAVTGVGLWWLPVVGAGLAQGWGGTLVRVAVFFGQAALVTFGGAYAVLPYVAQEAVERFGWLTRPQMLDGLAFAETTPGPLVMVLQHVGFMAGWTHPDGLAPWVSAVAAALLATWMTFAPCFLWVFLGAPHVENLRGRTGVNAALSGVTAAVVGVILSLAVWFGVQVIHPAPGTSDLPALALAVASFAALQWGKRDVALVILASGLLGLLVKTR